MRQDPTVAPIDTHIPFPPAEAVIPTPPVGFVSTPTSSYAAVAPRGAELLAAPRAVVELGLFTDYTETFGKTAPPLAQMKQMLDAAAQWSTMRAAMTAWDTYCKTQEEIAWKGVRAHFAAMVPAFKLVAKADPSVPATYPHLTVLLEAKRQISRRGASTRALNVEARKSGQPAFHGVRGRRLRRAAERAALARAKTSAP